MKNALPNSNFSFAFKLTKREDESFAIKDNQKMVTPVYFCSILSSCK